MHRYFILYVFILFSFYTKANDTIFNVKSYGAVGDGIILETDAINNAIIAASKAGGGTVYFPKGSYLSFSIRLRSNITLFIEICPLLW